MTAISHYPADMTPPGPETNEAIRESVEAECYRKTARKYPLGWSIGELGVRITLNGGSLSPGGMRSVVKQFNDERTRCVEKAYPQEVEAYKNAYERQPEAKKAFSALGAGLMFFAMGVLTWKERNWILLHRKELEDLKSGRGDFAPPKNDINGL